MRENRLNRQPSGPGRSTKRTRSSAGEAGAGSPSSPIQTPGAQPPPAAPVRNSALARAAAHLPRPPKNLVFTRRALVLVSVVAVLGLSFASSLRVWVVQSQQLSAAQAQIDRDTARVAQLEDALARWSDPAYVKARARERLGWVMPGEVGYRVVSRDGEVLSGTSAIEGVGDAQTSELAPRWWDKLATSLRHADAAPQQTDPLSTAPSPDTATEPAPADEPAGR